MELMALAAPSFAAILSFVFWLHKNRITSHKEMLDNFLKVENCVIELTTEVKQLHKFNEHLHDCVHEMKERIEKIDNRLWDHTQNNECDK